MDDAVSLRDPRDGILTLTLNRPDKRNALNLALSKALVHERVDPPNLDGLTFVRPTPVP